MNSFEAIVIGGGAVGMSTAYHLANEGVDVALLEKESEPAMHQSSRNSGVIHAGYNPKPGTLKAEYCVQGNRELREYCYDRRLPVREGGILIVAHNDKDIGVLQTLQERGIKNGASVRMLNEQEIKDAEPNAWGIAALQALDGASFDAKAYVQKLADDTVISGANILYDTQVDAIKETGVGSEVKTDKGRFAAKVVINAAGLYADTLAESISEDMRIIPFRGYYAEIKASKTHLVNSHINAAPDLDFPFLGVHLSKKTDGRVIVGPGAMLALGREGYSLTSIDGGGLSKTLSWPGFYRMLSKPEFRTLFRREIKKSILIRAIAKEAIGLVPSLDEDDLVRAYAGNRAQLVDRKGNLVDDIVVRDTDHAIHVLNAVSPGLTCSLPFGRHLAERAKSKL